GTSDKFQSAERIPNKFAVDISLYSYFQHHKVGHRGYSFENQGVRCWSFIDHDEFDFRICHFIYQAPKPGPRVSQKNISDRTEFHCTDSAIFGFAGRKSTW